MTTNRVLQFRAAALLALAVWLLPAATGRATTLLIEAENLEMTGGWQSVRETRGVREFLWSGMKGQPAPAAGAVELPKTGRWRLWVRSKDFPNDRPGIRNFTVRLGATRAVKVFGRHKQEGVNGWEWEDGGAFDLPVGPMLVVIGDASTGSARCDALVLTDDPDFRPKGLPHALKLPAAKMVPLATTTVNAE